MDQQVQAAWPDLLNGIARSLNPLHEAMFRPFPIDYYWSTYQSEWATDILFRDAAPLARLYPKLVHHGLTTFLSPDVMRFLGRNIPPTGKLPPRLKAEVTSDVKRRPEGVRIKHRLGRELDQDVHGMTRARAACCGSRPRSTTRRVQDLPYPGGQARGTMSWHRMRKGIADLHRRAEVSQAANNRYLQALASVEDTTPLGELAARLCQPARRNGRQVRCTQPSCPRRCQPARCDQPGEFTLNGFRNRDLRPLLFPNSAASKHEQRRQAAAVTRRLALLRAHRLINKVPGTHRYLLSRQAASSSPR